VSLEFFIHVILPAALWLWSRLSATNRKVAGSIPDSVTGIFHSRNPSGRTMALGSTQPLTEMSTRNISWGKGGRCVGLTTLTPSCADCLAVCEPQTRPVQACNGITVPYFYLSVYIILQKTEMSTRNISWGKGGRCVGLTTLTPSCADCLAVCEPQTRPVQACNGITLPYFTCPFTSLYRTVQMTMQTSYTLQMSTYLMNSCSMR